MKLSSMRADMVRRFTVRGLRINDHKKELVLLVRWMGTPAYQEAVANKAFRALEGDASNDEMYRLIAEHVVSGWEEAVDEAGDPIAYTAASGFDVFKHLKNEGRRDRLGEFVAFIGDGDNFQRELVEATTLGNR